MKHLQGQCMCRPLMPMTMVIINFWISLVGTYPMVGLCHLVLLISTIFHAFIVPASPSNGKILMGLCYSSLLPSSFEVTSLILMCPFTIASCGQCSQCWWGHRILSVMEIFQETRPQSNTNFIKDLDCNTLPQQYYVKCLRVNLMVTSCWSLPPFKTTHLLVLFRMDSHHSDHDELEAQSLPCVQSDLPVGPHDPNVWHTIWRN